MKRVALALAVLGLSTQVVVPAGAERLFGLVDTGELFVSADGGAHWSVHATLPVRDAVAIAAATNADDLFLCTRSGSIYHSSDGGSSWTGVGTVTAPDLVALSVLPDATLLTLSETGGVYASEDGGSSFVVRAVLTGSNWVSLTRDAQGSLYGLTRSGQVSRSDDDGFTWTEVAVLSLSNAVAMHRREMELLLLSETGEVFQSVDQGTSWTPVAALTSSRMRAIVQAGTSAVVATREGDVAVSADGVSWTWTGVINQLDLQALGVDTPQATDAFLGPGSRPTLLWLRPNPAHGSSEIGFAIARRGGVHLEVYDVRGRLRSRRDLGVLDAGPSSLRWEPQLESATYFVRLVTPAGASVPQRWTLVR